MSFPPLRFIHNQLGVNGQKFRNLALTNLRSSASHRPLFNQSTYEGGNSIINNGKEYRNERYSP
jgi:hypothetical protein